MPKEPFYLRHPIEILYEDDHFFVFNKPAGLLVIPTIKKENNTLVNIVNHQYVKKEGDAKLYPCHRLDKETSGVILFAKGKKAQKLMMDCFKERQIHKNYIAFVHGRLKKREGEIKRDVKNVESRKYQKRVQQKLGITKYKTIEAKKHYSILGVEPVTGRTNQIRIHFSQEGHPLVGDRKYSIARDYNLKFKRCALHASSLEWKNPFSHKKVHVTSNLPKDMEVFIARNRS